MLGDGYAEIVAWIESACGARNADELARRDCHYLHGKIRAAGGTDADVRSAVTNLLDLRHGRPKPTGPPPVSRWQGGA